MVPVSAAAAVAGASAFAWQTGPVQEWRLQRLDLPALSRLAAKGTSDPRLLYHLGRRLNDLERFTEADPLLRNAVGADPDAPRLRDEWTRALLGSGLVTAAFGQLQQYAGTHPNTPEAHLLLGKFYVTQNSMKRAQDELNRAIALNPNLAEAWSTLAVAQNAQATLGQARNSAEKAVALRPDNATDWLLLAGLRSRTQAPEADVQAAFETVMRLSPGLGAPWREWGRYLMLKGVRLPEAEAAARQALKHDPQDTGAFYILGRVLQQRRQWSDAADNLIEAANRARWDTAPVAALVQVLQAQKKTGEAQLWQERLQTRQIHNQRRDALIVRVQERPNDRAARLALARLWADEGDVARCLRQHAQAVRLASDAPRPLSAAARDLAKAGFAEDSIALARRAVEISPSSPDAHEALGEALLSGGQIREAAAEWDKASGWWPERLPRYQARLGEAIRLQKARASQPTGPGAESFLQARQLLATELSSTRFPKRVRTLAEDAVRQDPKNPLFLRFLLTVQLRQKDDAASQTAQRLVQATPQDPKARAALAFLLAQDEKDPGSLERAEAEVKEADALLQKSAGQKKVPGNATLHYARGLIALRRQQAQTAVREISRAILLDPEPDTPFFKLAQAHRMAGNSKAAQAAQLEFANRTQAKQAEVNALEALARHSENPALYEAAARVLRAHGKAAEAQAVLASRTRYVSGNERSSSVSK